MTGFYLLFAIILSKDKTANCCVPVGRKDLAMKTIPGRGHGMSKGPEVGMSLACSVNSKEVGMAGAESEQGTDRKEVCFQTSAGSTPCRVFVGTDFLKNCGKIGIT